MLHRVHQSPSVGQQLRGPNDCSNSSMLMEMSQLSVTDLFSGPSHSVVFRRSKSIFSILLLNLARAGARTTTADMDGRYLGGVWFLKVPRLILVIGLKILVPTCLVLRTKMD